MGLDKDGKKRDSDVESTMSDMSTLDPYEKPRKKSAATFLFGSTMKNTKGGYTSLFARKLLPPLGFYREADKYCHLKEKHGEDPDKVEAIEEMWGDYERYQIRKRFRWPPTLFFGKYFWTTGYYSDYQKIHRAKRIFKPGDDSSDDELQSNVIGAYLIAEGDNDINVEEFARYRDAKKLKKLRMTWAAKEHDYMNEKFPTRLTTFGRDKHGGDNNKDAYGKPWWQKDNNDKNNDWEEESVDSQTTDAKGKNKGNDKKGKKGKKSGKYDFDDMFGTESNKDSKKGKKGKGGKSDDNDDSQSDSGSDAGSKKKGGKGGAKGAKGGAKGRKSQLQEVETIVEYTIIKNPRKSGALEGLSQKEIKAATSGKTVQKVRKSVVTLEET